MVDPYARPRSESRRDWAVVFAGAVLGFFAWVFLAFVLFIATGSIAESTPGATEALVTWTLVAVFVCAVGLIVWPRTRRLGQGLLLGTAIGLVVAGGLCLPLLVAPV